MTTDPFPVESTRKFSVMLVTTSLIAVALSAQSYKEVVLKIPAPQGIYLADFSTCVAEDKAICEKVFALPICITKKYFDVGPVGGAWQVKDDLITMKTEFVGSRRIRPSSKEVFDDPRIGVACKILPSGDLVLQPLTAMGLRSTLTFRRQSDIKLLEAVELASAHSDQSNIGIDYTVQLNNLNESYAKPLLAIVKSKEPMKVRTEAANALHNIQNQDVVREAGEYLMTFSPPIDRDSQVLIRRIASILSDSHLPFVLDYAKYAYAKEIISPYTAAHMAAESTNKDSLVFVKGIAKTANDSLAGSLLSIMRKLNSTDALEIAHNHLGTDDENCHLEIVRTLAECSPDEESRDKNVKILFNRFSKDNSLVQSYIIETFGNAHTSFARECLTKMVKLCKSWECEFEIEDALAKYARG